MQIIEPKKYRSPQIFEEETEKIFNTQWLYACLTSDVSEFRDYVVIEIMGRSVIIFNNGKTIKAFQNVCPHRFNRIFPNEKGNGPLVCRYHLWGYNEEGKLIGKDKKNIYPSPIDVDICLKQYKIETVGKFIFIHFSDSPSQSLDFQLGDFKNELLLISDILGEIIHEQFIPHKANWKLIVENIIETHHCRAIHGETLVRSGYCIRNPEYMRAGKNSSFIIFPVEDELRAKRDALFKKYFERQVENNYFKHTLFFPNFSLAVSEGLIITIGQILPMNEGVTNYKLRYFYSKLNKENAVSKELLSDMKGSVIKFNDQVFAEDKEMLEQLQQGVQEVDHISGFIDADELRIKWFMETYQDIMKPLD